MFRWMLLIGAMEVGGCVQPPEYETLPPPMYGQEMEACAWRVVGGEKWQPPQVKWGKPDCEPFQGMPGLTVQGTCYRAFYLPDFDTVWIAYTESLENFSYSMTHELLHARLNRQGRRDPEHLDADWSRVNEWTDECYYEVR